MHYKDPGLAQKKSYDAINVNIRQSVDRKQLHRGDFMLSSNLDKSTHDIIIHTLNYVGVVVLGLQSGSSLLVILNLMTL